MNVSKTNIVSPFKKREFLLRLNPLLKNGQNQSFYVHLRAGFYVSAKFFVCFEPTHLSFSPQIGGTEEYKICRGVKEGRITKPVVCWCIGTCATMFSSEVSTKVGANAEDI